MRETQPPSGSNAPLIALLLLVATASGYYFYTPFESSRPGGEEPPSHVSTLGPEEVPARMWQDPFTAIALHRANENETERSYQLTLDKQQRDAKKAEGTRYTATLRRAFTESQDLTTLARQILQKKQASANIIAMPILVYGDSYAESVESRRRRRYAALSALVLSGYTPANPEHVGYFQIPWPSELEFTRDSENAQENHLCPTHTNAMGVGDKGTSSLRVPYEWFQGNTAHYGSTASQPPVLVLWLDDQHFSDCPLARLARLVHEIERPVKEKDQSSPLHFKIMGPAGSTTLHRMVKEAYRLKEDAVPASESFKSLVAFFTRKKEEDRGVEIYASSPTASANLLRAGLDENAPKETKDNAALCGQDGFASLESIREDFQKAGLSFYRTIPSDRQLARAICQELVLRGVEVDNPDHVIVLVSEWDTYYSRALFEVFADLFRKARRNKKTDDEAACGDRGVCRYSYFRGLDGKLPSVREQEQRFQSPKSAEGKVAGGANSLERSVGSDQLDYLRRLSWRVRQNIKDRKDVKAVGILAREVYDRFLVLQALRPYFPHAAFFTTTLDARYLHPTEYSWTRNLIVASGFDLRLHPPLQQGIPPFRDSYQTALFFAVQLALCRSQADPRPCRLPKRLLVKAQEGACDLQAHLNGLLKPRLFEIGRFEPVALPMEIHQGGLCSGNFSDSPLHPSIDERLDWWIKVKKTNIFPVTAAIILLIFGLLFGVFLFYRPLARLWSVLGGVTVVVILPLVITALLVSYEGLDGEPLAVGTSVWPTEMLRLMIFVLVGVLALRACRLQRENDYELARRYQLRGTKDEVSKTEVRHLWAHYLERHQWWRLWGYAFLLSLFLMGLTGLFVWILNMLGDFESHPDSILPFPSYPRSIYRGDLAYRAGEIIFLLVAFAFVWLLFFVVGIATLCRRFISQLSDSPVTWPSPTLQRFAEKQGISHGEDVSEWLTVQWIAARTRMVEGLMVYPFIISSLLILAHSPLFDRWLDRWNWMPVFLIFLLVMAIPVMSLVGLKNAAKEARRRVLDRMSRRLSQAKGKQDSVRAEQIQALMEDVQTNREGAFRSLGQQLKITLLPLGGIGGAALLEYLLEVSRNHL